MLEEEQSRRVDVPLSVSMDAGLCPRTLTSVKRFSSSAGPKGLLLPNKRPILARCQMHGLPITLNDWPHEGTKPMSLCLTKKKKCVPSAD